MGRPLTQALAGQQQLIQQQGDQIRSQASQIQRLQRESAVQRVAFDYLADMAGLKDHVAAIYKQADIANPGQPVPDPPSGGPTETSEQTATPEAYDSPVNPGQTPGSVNQLPADATGTALDPGASVPTAPYNQLVDVTAPVAGTEMHIPNEQTRTEVDVRVGDPMNLQRAFPWEISQDVQGNQPGQPGGGSVTGARTSGNRTMASMRLAQLRRTAGISNGEDLAVAAQIDSDKSISDSAIENEIQTLGKVASARQSQAPANLVPRSAGSVRRTTPSLVSQGSTGAEVTGSDVDDSDIFLD